jgi:hypothetical protein
MMRFLESVLDFFIHLVADIARAKELFLGAALTAIGVMSIDADKFCDGNTADYLSCTRPTTYYSYDMIDISLVVIGITLILVWVLRHSRKHG